MPKGVYKRTEYHRKINSVAHTGIFLGERSPSWKGGKPKCSGCGKEIFYARKTCIKCRRIPDEVRLKMSHSHKGLNTWMKGKRMSEETKQKISESLKGEKNHQWLPDRTKLKRYSDDHKNRRSPIYKRWRYEVIIRDGYQCRLHSTECSGKLEIHHIEGYTQNPSLRYDIKNGITLCRFHHPRKRIDEMKLAPLFKKMVKKEK